MANLPEIVARDPNIHRWDKDAARYWCQQLRALADLIEAGEPAGLEEITVGPRGALTEVSVTVNTLYYLEAAIAVRHAVDAGEGDYLIRTTRKAR